MRAYSSLQQQWAIAFLGTTAAVVGVVTCIAWSIADRQVRSQVEQRLSDIGRIVSRPAYPMNQPVLQSIAELTSAELVIVDVPARQTLTTFDEAWEPETGQVPKDGNREMRFNHRFQGPNGQLYHAGWIRFDPSDRTEESASGMIGILLPHALSRQMQWQSLFLPLITGAATAIGLGAVAAWLTHRIVHRLQVVQGKVQLIASGDYTTIALDGARDELYQLTENVNRMSQELDGLHAKIKANERDQLLDSFAAGLSHDLRNTLTGARLAIQLHAKQCRQDEESIDVAMRQLRLAEDQLARWIRLGDSDKTAMNRRLANILENATLLVQPMVDHFGGQLAIERDPEADRLQIAYGDLLESAILNLLLNAIQAAGQSGKTRLTSRLCGGGLQIEVVDNGPGPAEEIQRKMFEPLVTSKREGVGLGLTLVARTARLLGGTIEWQRSNGWTTFKLMVYPSENPPIQVPFGQEEQAQKLES